MIRLSLSPSCELLSKLSTISRWQMVQIPLPPVKSRFGPKPGFGGTPGELLTISKPNPYPKPEKPPARKGFTKPNLWNPLGRFDGESVSASRSADWNIISRVLSARAPEFEGSE